ncbi:Alpha/beta-Hydrolases superfamily protein [Balamuthia mandrillaris]
MSLQQHHDTRRVFFHGGENQSQTLVGLFQPCTDRPGCKDVVVLCHGLLCTKDSFFFPLLSRRLSSFVHVVRFDFRSSGLGDSQGSFSYGAYRDDVDDLGNVVRQLEEKPEGYRVRAVVGHSKGGNIVLLYAAAAAASDNKADDDDVRPLVVNVSARFRMRGEGSRFSEEQLKEMEEKGKFMWRVRDKYWEVTKEGYEERASVDMTVVRDIQSKVLTIHGDSDEVIPLADAHMFHEHIPHHELQVIAGASHFYHGKYEELVAAIVRWLSKELNPPHPRL